MTEKMRFTQATLLAKRAKELSLKLYRGKQDTIPNTSILYREDKPIRMLSERKSKNGSEIVSILMLAQLVYSSDQIVLISDGGLVAKEKIDIKDFTRITETAYHRRESSVARSIMVVEAKNTYQNIGFLPYDLREVPQLGESGGLSRTSLLLTWLEPTDFNTEEISGVVRDLFSDIMAQNTLRDQVKNNSRLVAISKILEQEGKDIHFLEDLAGDRKMEELGCIVHALS